MDKAPKTYNAGFQMSGDNSFPYIVRNLEANRIGLVANFADFSHRKR